MKGKILIIMLLVVVTTVLGSSSVFAAHTSNVKPGWGFGDQNHVHTGPPGQTVQPVNQSNTAQVNNRLVLSAHTGGNRAVGSSGSVSFISGPVSFVASIINTLNTNIFGK
jgi:hypothetical protein